MDNNTNKAIQDHANSSRVLSSISSNQSFVFVLKKAERLASALYLITGFFDDKEPLRWKLRTLGPELISLSLSLKDGINHGKEEVITDMKNKIFEIGGLLSVAKNAGLISPQNYTIIDEEFSNLLNTISEGSKSELSQDFFGERSLPREALISAPVSESPYRSTAPAPRIATPLATETKGQTKSGLLDDYKDFVKEPRERKPKTDGAVSIKKNGRQTIILDMLKKKNEIMIKDVAPLISDCSEKTIQRELLAMVSAGILKKEGEKRWSRYSLANE